jgi:hypothetical protein
VTDAQASKKFFRGADQVHVVVCCQERSPVDVLPHLNTGSFGAQHHTNPPTIQPMEER